MQHAEFNDRQIRKIFKRLSNIIPVSLVIKTSAPNTGLLAPQAHLGQDLPETRSHQAFPHSPFLPWNTIIRAVSYIVPRFMTRLSIAPPRHSPRRLAFLESLEQRQLLTTSVSVMMTMSDMPTSRTDSASACVSDVIPLLNENNTPATSKTLDSAILTNGVRPSFIQATELTAVEGTPLTLQSVLSDEREIISYAWSVTKDATAFSLPEATITNQNAFTFTPTDSGNYQVSVTVTYDGGSLSEITSITVTNAAPTAVLFNDGPLYRLYSGTIAFREVVEPSSVDSASGFHYSFASSLAGLATTYATAGDAASKSLVFSTAGQQTVYGRVFDKDDGYTDYTTIVTVNPSTSVAQNSRRVFYNNSWFDGANPNANTGDDGAIATDKSALLPGDEASLANYTSYSKGLNGIMVDLEGLVPGSVLSASDFEFLRGNMQPVAQWTSGPVPSNIAVRCLTEGLSRVTIIWRDYDQTDPTTAVAKQWLQIRVKANANTGLPSEDIFYFGNAIGETGHGNAKTGSGSTTKYWGNVSATDEIYARNNVRLRVPVTDLYDFNRDSLVNATDQIIARSNVTVPNISALQMITVPSNQLASGDVTNAGFDLPTLAVADLGPIIQEAIAVFASRSVDVQRLTEMASASFVVQDLPGDILGMTDKDVVYLDRDAARRGWFIDLTPDIDEEFQPTTGSVEFEAIMPSTIHRIDLLTVVCHELGHIVGLRDLAFNAENFMAKNVKTGERRLPTVLDLVDLLPSLTNPSLSPVMISGISISNVCLASSVDEDRFQLITGALFGTAVAVAARERSNVIPPVLEEKVRVSVVEEHDPSQSLFIDELRRSKDRKLPSISDVDAVFARDLDLLSGWRFKLNELLREACV